MMKKIMMIAVAVASGVALAEIYGDAPDAKHAWAVHDWNRPKPGKVEAAPYVQTQAPSDAIVLFDGTKESLEKNWCDKDGNPTQWRIGDEGDFYCVTNRHNGGAIFTKEKFGDCQLHVEYRHNPETLELGKGPQMRGNSGVFLMGPDYGYEIQVLESYTTSKEAEGKDGYVDNYADGQAGAVYAENPPLVNPARKAGEWQVYDIVFHQPVFEGERVVHPGSVTVLFNGVLVQDHWEMEGQTTHRTRRPYAAHPKTGPLSFQDHGCEVHFRNVWIRPIASRWNNKTHSTMSADENEVRKLRRETAAKLFAKIERPIEPTIKGMMQVAECVQYSREGEILEAWKKIAYEFHDVLDAASDEWWNANRGELIKLRNQLNVLIKAGIVPQDCGTRRRINAAALRLGWEK